MWGDRWTSSTTSARGSVDQPSELEVEAEEGSSLAVGGGSAGVDETASCGGEGMGWLVGSPSSCKCAAVAMAGVDSTGGTIGETLGSITLLLCLDSIGCDDCDAANSLTSSSSSSKAIGI